MGSFYDFSPGCVHAVRVEGALRGRHRHVLGRPPLRPHRTERRRQVDVHEAADRRARRRSAAPWSRPTRSACCGRISSPSTQFRVIDTVIMGNTRLWSALEERELLYAQERPDRRRRHAPRRARRHRRRRGRLLGRERRRRCCCRGSTSPRRCTSGRWPSCRAARRCACCWPRRCSAIPRRCCSTSRPTTSTSTRFTGCASSWCATTAR